jgi:hypothetical protein
MKSNAAAVPPRTSARAWGAMRLRKRSSRIALTIPLANSGIRAKKLVL